MTATVQLFAAARDRANAPSIAVEVLANATVADLRTALVLQCPGLAGLLPLCRIAVNHDFAEDADRLPEAAELAVIPPVSGG